MIPMLLKQPAKVTDGQQRARRFYIGRSEPEFERRFQCKATEVFGSTETGIVTMTPPGLTAPNGSCGKANEDTFEVIVADENDEPVDPDRSEEHTSELQSLMRNSYAVFCLK